MKNSSLLTRGLVPLFGLIFFILLWQLTSGFYHQVVLPSPLEVARSAVKLTAGGQLWEQGGQTIGRGLAGFSLAVLVGLPLGLFIGLSPLISSLLRPLIVGLQVTPLVSWLLLAMIWLGFSKVPSFVVFVTTLPLIIINTIQGVRNIDKQLLQVAQVFQINRARLFREIYLPQVLPYLLAGIITALGTTWKAVAMAEFLSVSTGVGARMAVARINLETADLFAWTFVLVGLGLLTDRLLSHFVNKKLRHWM
ncbi:MAG: ABC transporter permease [Peptococcaceae bacterium]|nr:ABC transporter permease [Candidatus Syntrophopropionicum ammoniitolerans]